MTKLSTWPTILLMEQVKKYMWLLICDTHGSIDYYTLKVILLCLKVLFNFCTNYFIIFNLYFILYKLKK